MSLVRVDAPFEVNPRLQVALIHEELLDALRAGQSIEWPVPDGRTIRLQVLEVRDQPEAAGDYHR